MMKGLHASLVEGSLSSYIRDLVIGKMPHPNFENLSNLDETLLALKYYIHYAAETVAGQTITQLDNDAIEQNKKIYHHIVSQIRG